MDTKARFEDLKEMIFITLWSGPNGEQFLVNTLKETNTYYVLIGTHLEDRLPNLDHVFECGRIWPKDVPEDWTMTEIDNPFVFTSVYKTIDKERWPAEVAEILKETAQ